VLLLLFFPRKNYEIAISRQYFPGGHKNMAVFFDFFLLSLLRYSQIWLIPLWDVVTSQNWGWGEKKKKNPDQIFSLKTFRPKNHWF